MRYRVHWEQDIAIAVEKDLSIMARKSKRLILNEAIRQRHAPIAEGLKTGQMRSDRDAPKDPEKDIKGPVRIDELSADKRDTDFKSDFFKSKEISTKYGIGSSATKPKVLIYTASVVLLGLFIWILIPGNSDEPAPSGQESGQIDSEMEAGSETAIAGQTETSESRGFWGGRKESSETTETETEIKAPTASLPQGDNVIWIQSISAARKDELRPVAGFFEDKGILTEIIIDPASGLAVLVTKAGFEENPKKAGTEGYALLQRIKQLGPVYVEETQDTKFGIKPFQDAYGYKIR